MRVLHILNELKPSGAEIMLELAAPHWISAGCELHMAALAPAPGPQAGKLRAAGWSISAIDPTRGIIPMVKSIIATIREIRPDVVHLHQEGRSLPICLAVWLAKVPMVRTVHNNFPFEGLLRRRKALERWLCRCMGSRHLAISPSVQKNELIRFRNPTTLCWNWFDTERFRPATREERESALEALGIPPGQRAIVSVGNGSDVKNYRVIIEALAAINDPHLHYYQVGNPHPDGVDQALAATLDVSSQVHFVGPQSDVLKWLWASDLYAMPSVFEGYGLAAVEGMAAGCDCLFSDSPGLSDFRGSDLHVRWSLSDRESFREALALALASPAAPEQSLTTSENVRSLFSVKNRSKAYYDIWNEARS